MAQVGSVRIDRCRIFLVQRNTIVVAWPSLMLWAAWSTFWIGTGIQGLRAHRLCTSCWAGCTSIVLEGILLCAQLSVSTKGDDNIIYLVGYREHQICMWSFEVRIGCTVRTALVIWTARSTLDRAGDWLCYVDYLRCSFLPPFLCEEWRSIWLKSV